ncbi:S26 family signal peptidase [Streptosporangium sp. NPDC049248]|uniref:S26 family signal peptidase n=1 Tax=Streptosporangium sp. NPDC049248 TaxID=3155651 RepID=UPI00341E60EA
MIGVPLLASFGVIIVLLLRRKLLIVAVTGPSMEPNYIEGDRLLAWRRSPRHLHPGQVVVIDTAPPSENPGPPMNIIKRVVAVPGQLVPGVMRGNDQGMLVPPNHVVVLGDNRRRSVDSRHLGFISADRVVATVIRKMNV